MEPPSKSTASRYGARFGCCLALGFVVTIVVMVALRVAGRGTYVPLNAETFAAAQAQWREQAVPDYDIEIKVTGRQESRYRVEVRDGDPVAAYRNDAPLPQRRTWNTWTVPGMFGTAETDLQQLQRAARGEPGIPGLSVLVQFHPKYGFPLRYLRVESVRKGANPEVTWEVTSFEPLAGAGDAR